MSATPLITCALDDWTDSDCTDGVQIEDLSALETLSVRTRNTTYHIIVTSPDSGDVLVRGGARFPEFTSARVCGSTRGGTLLKCAGVYSGLHLELECEGRRIVTSTVISVEIVPHSSEH